MTTSRRLLSNTAVVVAGSTVQRLLNFGTTLLLARGLGGEQFGTYAFVVAYMVMFTFLADLGFERVISRDVAREPERAGELLGAGLIVRGALSVVAAVAAVAVAWMIELPPVTRSCIVLAAIGLPLSVEILVRSFFQARFEMHYTYLLSLPGSITFLMLAALLVRWGAPLPALFAVGLATGVMNLSLMLWIAVPKMGLVWRVDRALIRYLWHEAWVLGAVIFVYVITLRIDQLLLYWLRGPAELAQYAVAVKVTEALNLLPEAVMVTVFPLLATTERSNPEQFRRIYEGTVRYLTVVVLALALLITLERDVVIRMLFGSGYAGSAGALTILAWWMFFAYTGGVYLALMVVRSQQRLIAVVSAAALVVNVVLNVAWIPSWGAAGAAAAMFASSAASFGMFCFAPQTRSIMRVCCEQAIRPGLAVAGAALIAGLCLPRELRVFAALPLYAVILSMIGGIGRKDWALARSLWQPARGQP